MRAIVKSSLFCLLGVILALLVGEVFVRVATSDQNNYVMEMWRYAKLIKQPSRDPAIGHEHKPNQQAQLQHVTIRTNSLGLRGPELRADDTVQHRIAVIGDSIALGWGVTEEQTLSAQLNQKLGSRFEVVNAGVGNMNLSQIMTHWQQLSSKVAVDTVVVLVTPRAAETQSVPSTNWFLQNSALCALLSTVVQRIAVGGQGKTSLVEHYQGLWTTNYPMIESAFAHLADMQAKNHFQIIVVVIPEANDMNHYAFSFINQAISTATSPYNWGLIDALPVLQGSDTSQWHVSKNDIHLNGKAFDLIAEQIKTKIVENIEHDKK